ncbi:MAG: ArsR family transcriptional regulator [Crenarchaeota archaeon]|nr:MAG: ArsR family transcriptional regulator [Thermoproteota archaeon]RDJ34217.1 MAG: ArsR family transcriptional regulator [Thermoproteota archaeon]RDJ36669.1 MAG: ArsR family transcriptional regulator [Thermoproteota archaeon]RDJ37799.1 MAG: ArsR family transcriptional regulator [Thermoproteota archaeon]
MTRLKKITSSDIQNEKITMRILSSLTHPKTVKNISEECQIPIASAYRRVKLLHKIGLLSKSGNISDGIRTRLYSGHNVQEKE